MEQQKWEESEKKGKRKKIREEKESKEEGTGVQKIQKHHKTLCFSYGSWLRVKKAGWVRSHLGFVVARSTFRSQNVEKKSACSDHFCTLRCGENDEQEDR